MIFLRDTTLMAQRLDLDRLVLTGEPRPVAEQVELNGPASATFTVSDAGLLAYQPAAGRGSQLVWLDRDGRQLGTVGDAAQYGDLELSPDGRQAAVSVLDTATNTRDLWVFDVARGVRTRFTFDPGDEVLPIWSADGTRMFFTVEPQWALRSVSEGRERRRDRRAGVRGRRQQVSNQPVAGRPVPAVLDLRRGRYQSVGVAPDGSSPSLPCSWDRRSVRASCRRTAVSSPTRPPSPGAPKSTSCRFRSPRANGRFPVRAATCRGGAATARRSSMRPATTG